MAETNIAVTTPPGSDPVLPMVALSAALPFVAADIVNNNSYVSTGRELVIVQNSDAAAQTVTISSSADERGRLGDITAYSIPAGAFAVLGPFRKQGWARNDGTVKITCSTVTVKLAVVRLPSIA